VTVNIPVLAEISVALERAQRTSTVGLLTAGFAHEMKNALTVVLGFAELARTAAERAPSEPKVTRHLKELENETRRTVAQLQSFMSYSSGERGPRIPRDVNELVRDALSMVRPMARMKELQLQEVSGEPPRVVCDPFAVPWNQRYFPGKTPCLGYWICRSLLTPPANAFSRRSKFDAASSPSSEISIRQKNPSGIHRLTISGLCLIVTGISIA